MNITPVRTNPSGIQSRKVAHATKRMQSNSANKVDGKECFQSCLPACQSFSPQGEEVPMWPLPMMHWTSSYMKSLSLTCSSMLILDFTVKRSPALAAVYKNLSAPPHPRSSPLPWHVFQTLLLTAREGNVFRGVCHSFCSLGGGSASRERGVCLHRGSGQSPHPPFWCWHPVAATAAISTHPTGMHSC